jgi:hypothetical protein
MHLTSSICILLIVLAVNLFFILVLHSTLNMEVQGTPHPAEQANVANPAP